MSLEMNGTFGFGAKQTKQVELGEKKSRLVGKQNTDIDRLLLQSCCTGTGTGTKTKLILCISAWSMNDDIKMLHIVTLSKSADNPPSGN